MNNKQITTASELQQALIDREVEMPEFTIKVGSGKKAKVYPAKLGGYRLNFPSVCAIELWQLSAEVSWHLALMIYQGKTKQVEM